MLNVNLIGFCAEALCDLTLKAPEIKIVEFTYSADPDKAALHKPPYLHLQLYRLVYDSQHDTVGTLMARLPWLFRTRS